MQNSTCKFCILISSTHFQPQYKCMLRRFFTPVLVSFLYYNQKFELCSRDVRKPIQQFRFSSLTENWGVHAKLIYKYQILYLDRITIVPWRHLVNDIDLCRSPKSPKKSIKSLILAFKVIQGH